MSANTTLWCLKLTCLPKGIKAQELATVFGIESDRIGIPTEQGSNYYAWVNGFSDKSSAEEFEKRWNRTNVRGSTIVCKVATRKRNVLERSISTPRVNNPCNSNTAQEQFASKNTDLKHNPSVSASTISSINDDTEDNDDTNDGILSPIWNSSNRQSRSPSLNRERSRSILWSACPNGIDYSNPPCKFDYSESWQACEDGVDCEDFDCSANHPYGRKEPCMHGARCKNIACELIHPTTRMGECEDGDQCDNFYCKALHQNSRPKPCCFGKQCLNTLCKRLHPPERRMCSNGDDCTEFDCQLDHPPGRMMRCSQGNGCSNFYCNFLHPDDWDPCEDGSECKNLKCTHTVHPLDRNLGLKQSTIERKQQKQSDPLLKSAEQRKVEREKAQLPILASKNIFCERLKNERILVVTAETGSGKSTQLPQYAAEYFGGLVVCTQPRVLAAISLARRVANEYDGTSVGRSVGYRIGRGGAGKGTNQVPGADIVFMTDSALIQESQLDRRLSNVKVLIIDEAHERSLNTDIVIGLAKLLLNERPNDFYVVIASATIDPIKFLKYFDREDAKALDVPGRIYNVSVEYMTKSDESTDEQHAVSILSQLYENHQGHTLVFLPGQREIERALELFNQSIPDNCVALPLYGSLSPEEQDRVLQFDEGPTGEYRMVVFCTNIAETSLTIKNTRLVIDLGLAKEAHFDTKRRLTVIETVRISRSSADQRKGRAGRTAPGHCVRLYKNDDLIRPNIEPEILRSSLDLVVLQLICLKLKPQLFPFMDLPSHGQEILQQSLEHLKNLQCIDVHDTITLRGELFAQLGLDPRLSAFLIDTYAKHGPILEVTAAIVSILTAPGFIFFMGGANKEEKEKARGKVAVGAQEYESDLLYFLSTYEKWKQNGKIDSTKNCCITCGKTIKAKLSCRSCRTTYSVQNTLNNKVLTTVENSCDTLMNIIKNKRWQLNPMHSQDANHNSIIGKYLLKYFPEHYGHLIVSHLPNEGVRMVANDFRARITANSVFVQRRLNTSHFIAMTITQLPTGIYVVERLHPIDPSTETNPKRIQKLGIVRNVGWEYNEKIRKEASNCKAESWNKWLVHEYDRRQCCVTLWGEASMAKLVRSTYTSVVQKAKSLVLTQSRSFVCGPIQAKFESGLRCCCIENSHENNSTKNRLDLHRVPCKTLEEFYAWIEEKLGVRQQNIREHNFQLCKEPVIEGDTYESPPFFVVFDSDEIFKWALSHIPPFNVCPQKADAFDAVHMRKKETWGRQLLLKSQENEFLTADKIKTECAGQIVSCQPIGKRLLPGLQITNMPRSINQTHIQQILGNNLCPERINIFYSDQNNPSMGSSSVRIYFRDTTQCRQAKLHLQSSLILNPHEIKIFSKKSSRIKDIRVEPSIKEIEVEPPTFLITAISRRIALDMYSNLQSNWIVNSSATVMVTYVDLYPKLNELVKGICERFRLEVQEISLPAKNNAPKATRYIFTDGTPPKTALAASMLSQATSPIIIKLADERQKCLFNELFTRNLIQTWASELQLSCEKKDKYGAIIEIHGPQIEQGQLMRRIADYADDFDHRYRVLDLSSSMIGFFGHQKAADVKLQEINALWTPKGCSVTMSRRTNFIILYAQPEVSTEMIQNCEKEVKELLDKLTTTNENDDEANDFSRKCAFCHQTMIATCIFRICGHAYCRCAVSMLNQLPLKCPTCSSKIHIQDIKEMFSNSKADFTGLCKRSIQDYLLSSTKLEDQDQLFCPNNECDGLISRSRGYQICLTCAQGVCGLCRLIEDDLHEGRTCDERNEAQKLSDFIPQLFKAAETFAKDKWSIDLPPIINFEANPFLKQAPCESLNRFYKGVEHMGDKPPPDLARGFFAFHGTSTDAIEAICKLGFDPSRRKGQVYGPGEYFGITAAVSHGYSKNTLRSTEGQMMIIAFILQCDRVRTQPGFCYVVNNPVDWSASFNLPVAVVTYGNKSSTNLTIPRIFTTHVSNNANKLSDTIKWEPPFRWHWQQDNKTFEPYNDEINNILEQFYEKWKLEQGPFKVVTPALIRYVDDISQTYDIDFKNQTQRNTRTGYICSIERRRMPQSIVNVKRNWFYLNENNVWAPYESLIQQTIEDSHRAYSLNQGPSKLVIRFLDRPEQYELNFVNGTQRNKSTGVIRRIKSIDIKLPADWVTR